MSVNLNPSRVDIPAVLSGMPERLQNDAKTIWKVLTKQDNEEDLKGRTIRAVVRILLTLGLLFSLAGTVKCLFTLSILGTGIGILSSVACYNLYVYVLNCEPTVKNIATQIAKETVALAHKHILNPLREHLGGEKKPMPEEGPLSLFDGMIGRDLLVYLYNAIYHHNKVHRA